MEFHAALKKAIGHMANCIALSTVSKASFQPHRLNHSKASSFFCLKYIPAKEVQSCLLLVEVTSVASRQSPQASDIAHWKFKLCGAYLITCTN